MDIFKLASQIANNISDGDKEAMENMDMEKMISHVTQNVFKMMNGVNGSGGIENPMDLLKGLAENTISTHQEKKLEKIIYPKTRDICFDLNVDLQDFYTGKKKKLNVKRKRIIEVDGKQTVVEEKKKLTVIIEKGMKDEQQIKFEGEADQIPGHTPGDIIITLLENEHPYFQRDNDNLVYIKNINLYQNYDIKFDIKHLDDRVLRIHKTEESLHMYDGLRKIKHEGMPCFKSNEHGDLFIRFNLEIPKTLEPSKLATLKELFDTPEVLSPSFSKKYVLENMTDTDLEELTSDYSSESDSETISSVSSASD